MDKWEMVGQGYPNHSISPIFSQSPIKLLQPHAIKQRTKRVNKLFYASVHLVLQHILPRPAAIYTTKNDHEVQLSQRAERGKP